MTAAPRPESWYAATAAPFPKQPPLDADRRVEFCVIGGGYAGLSAALHLAEAGREVVLLEAERIGWGASGRNGGQLGHGPRADIRLYEKLLGAEHARRIWEISTEATALTKALIARHGIACDPRSGSIEAAWRPSHLEDMARHAEHVATRYGYDGLRALDVEEMRARCASPRYHGGVEDREAGHLHPLDYALGLARAALAAGATLHEDSRVLSIGRDGAARTARGTVRAERIILACNGYLDALAPDIAARTAPIANFIVATKPLDESPLPRNDCVADSKFVLNYFRMSRDGRLLFGGGETYSRRFPADIPAFVRPYLETVFPQLKGVEITHGWGGVLAITRHRVPLFRRLGPRTLAIGGWSGSGVHMATMGGRIAAEAAQGPSAAWDALASVPCPRFPGGRLLRPALLALAMKWFALRDRL